MQTSLQHVETMTHSTYAIRNDQVGQQLGGCVMIVAKRT